MRSDFTFHLFAFIIVGISVLYSVFLHYRLKIYGIRLKAVLNVNRQIEHFFNIFSKNLKTVEEIDDSMNNTAKYVSEFVGAVSVCIFVLEDNRFLKAAGIYGAFPPLHKSPEYILTKPRYILESLRREKILVGEGIIGKIAESREPLFIQKGSKDPRILAIDSIVQIESFMAVPMLRENKVAGVVCAVNNRRDGEPFSPEQFSSFKLMADQVGLAYGFISVYANLSRQQRINQEIEFTKQLQAAMLPKGFPEKSTLSVQAFYRSAKEVGGDFYDFVEIDNNRMLIVIGDACGKGIPACLLMAITTSFIRANAQRFATLNELMIELNDNLFRDTSEEKFVTVACCLIDYSQNIVEYARAGHTELLVKSREHKTRTVFPEGAALGLMPSNLAGGFDTLSFIFQPGMTLLLFTDGITESVNEADKEFGIERLVEVFNNACTEELPSHEIIERILRNVDDFTESKQQADDQTLLVIKHS